MNTSPRTKPDRHPWGAWTSVGIIVAMALMMAALVSYCLSQPRQQHQTSRAVDRTSSVTTRPASPPLP